MLDRLKIAMQSAQSWAAAPYSRIFIASDQSNWALHQEMLAVKAILRKLGLPAYEGMVHRSIPQIQHFTSQFVLQELGRQLGKRKFSVDYFHGLPGTSPEFSQMFENIKKYRQSIGRIRTSYSEMTQLLIDAGLEPHQVMQIPIGYDSSVFRNQESHRRDTIRTRLGIPKTAVVFGSFQKDGTGWGDGLEPKLIKGPDVLADVLTLLKGRIPELWVLLTGPARGYVKKRLEEARIPYTHQFMEAYHDVAEYYQALDGYIVASRQEGGPKAILESMASGVPIISTRAGQAIDMIEHRVNGWICDVEDRESLAACALEAVGDSKLRETVIRNALTYAPRHSYQEQGPAWRSYFEPMLGTRP